MKRPRKSDAPGSIEGLPVPAFRSGKPASIADMGKFGGPARVKVPNLVMGMFHPTLQWALAAA